MKPDWPMIVLTIICVIVYAITWGFTVGGCRSFNKVTGSKFTVIEYIMLQPRFCEARIR